MALAYTEQADASEVIVNPNPTQIPSSDAVAAAHTELWESRLENMRAFLFNLQSDATEQAIRTDRDAFSSTLLLAVDEYGVKVRDLAQVLSVDKGVISRWKSGAHAPVGHARPQILHLLAKFVEERIQQLREEHTKK